ncbi:hypothetical protein [uncultured Pseudokineococcus sp.]|uniref:hypothetical protein n=1 Tax=uncultured Pseudokineococcus sp. TaxID=1642928 RepID=UPI00261B24F9|nr:hypothetical protein [uncultured Pseudokineococcus sp.]
MRVHTVLSAATTALVAAACLAPSASAAEAPATFLAVDAGAPVAGVVVDSAPTGLSGRVDGRKSALSWNPVPGATSYAIWEPGTPGRPVTTVTSPSRTSGDLADGTYAYSVSARFADGTESSRTAEVELLVGSAATPTPAPTTPSASTSQRASWTAPTLVDPLVWDVSASNATFTAPANRDVLIRWPSTPLDVQGGVKLNGGRNVVSKGGTVKFSKRYFASMEDKPNDNRCLRISGNARATGPRTVHVEGLHCAGKHIWEGINVDSQGERGTLTVQLRDIRIDGVHVEHPGRGKHIGGDALQTWNGPHRLRVDGFTAKNLEYQGLYLQPYRFGSGKLGAWDIRNVNLEGASKGSAYLMWLAGSRNASASDGVDLTVKDVYVLPGGGRSRTRTLWDAANDWSEVKIGEPGVDFVP